jgi:hypothetical protein
MADPKLEFMLSEARPDEGRLTTANLQMRVHGSAIWPVLGEDGVSIEIQIDDLLSQITEFWKPLMLRQVYPLAANPDRPSLFRAEVARRWGEMPSELADQEDDVLTAFEEAHDLSRAFAGQFGLPAFWLMRAGDQMVCESAGRTWRLDYAETRCSLSVIGDAIAARLGGHDEGRWGSLIEAWRARDRGEAASLLAWSTGLSAGTAAKFIAEQLLAAPTGVADAANDDDELRLAARMAGGLPEAETRRIIELARTVKPVEAPELDALSSAVKAHLSRDFADHAPFAQGEAAASFVREAMGFASVQVVDIFALVSSLGAPVHCIDAAPPTLDGLAVWGPKHGPGALINQASRRIANRGRPESNTGARVTLAHELCHLLIDRGQALSAVDVLGGRMPRSVERRAKAFAGEFLLPGRVAADIWLARDQPTAQKELTAFLDRLARRYGVTRTVAAWKLDHGLRRHGVDLGFVLDLIVPDR